jgi:hypothetical protein
VQTLLVIADQVKAGFNAQVAKCGPIGSALKAANVYFLPVKIVNLTVIKAIYEIFALEL